MTDSLTEDQITEFKMIKSFLKKKEYKVRY